MSLYIAAKRTKLGINLGVFLLVSFVIVKISWNIGELLWYRLNPPEIAPAESLYGRLPELNIDSLPLKKDSNPTYRLETTLGQLPEVPDRAPVYKLQERKRSITIEPSAIDFAESLGFVGDERIEESATIWKWEDNENQRKLKLNILTNDFELTTDLKKVSPTIPRGTVPNLEGAKNRASDLITSITKNNESFQLREADIIAHYVQINGESVERVDKIGEAQMVDVNFFINIPVNPQDFPATRRDLLPDNFWIMTSNPAKGVVQMYITSSSNPSYKQPQIKFSSQRLSLNENSTYPLKNISDVWEEVKAGQANISYLKIQGDQSVDAYVPLSVKSIDIRSVLIAYLDTGQPFRKYLQPIFVFEGEAQITDQLKADYTSYVSAVHPSCIAEDSSLLEKPCGPLAPNQ